LVEEEMRLRTALVLAIAMIAVTAHSTAQSTSLAVVMNEKADNAQGLLKPLVIGDFAGVDHYAERLGRLTSTEIASWQDRPEASYLKQANGFVEAVQALREASRARDVERAFAAHTALISSCVGCHQLVQARRSAS
jgi:hypothetical protein